jgi:hypothetical protein
LAPDQSAQLPQEHWPQSGFECDDFLCNLFIYCRLALQQRLPSAKIVITDTRDGSVVPFDRTA